MSAKRKAKQPVQMTFLEEPEPAPVVPAIPNVVMQTKSGRRLELSADEVCVQALVSKGWRVVARMNEGQR